MNTLPFETSLRVLDLVLFEGCHLLLHTSIALLRQAEPTLLAAWNAAHDTGALFRALKRVGERVVDADALVLEDLSPIFERLEKAKISFAAAPDIFPPDKFNAGVLGIAVRSENENSDGAGDYSPSGGSVKISSQDAEDILAGMISRLAELGTYDGGDTGFLNLFFPNWWHSSPPAARLPFRYNAQRTLHWFTYSQQPGYWDVCKPIAVLHFSSSPKPWECPEKKGELELIWWEHFASALSAS